MPLAVLLLDPPVYLETAKVLEMLLALPGHGRVKAVKALDACRISPSKTSRDSARATYRARRAPEPLSASSRATGAAGGCAAS